MRSFFLHSILIICSACLFALSFPSKFFVLGLGFLAYFALAPYFFVLFRARWYMLVLYGLVFGYGAYVLFNIWLRNFHPLAIIIVPIIMMVQILCVSIVMKFFVQLVVKRYGHAEPRIIVPICVIIWVLYEWIKIQGFLGYPYGIIGYTQYLFVTLINIADITGVFGVSVLVITPSIVLAHVCAYTKGSFLTRIACLWTDSAYRVVLCGYCVLFVCAILYGIYTRVDYSAAPQRRLVLVQQNIDPWRGGTITYKRSLDILMEQSTAALESHSDVDMVVWSETSFVPSINYHNRYRHIPRSYELVSTLQSFLATQRVPFVFGNSERVLVKQINNRHITDDFNAVLLYDEGVQKEKYFKIKLVPFSEYFPYKKQLPKLYRWLQENNTTFWRKGQKYTIFTAAGMQFATPICFEDSFGFLNRQFVKKGAQVLINVTNDAWSFSEAAARQHLAMAVFRAVENKRSMVRATNSGMTALISPNGDITQVMPAFQRGYMLVDVPVFTERETLYTRFGSFFIGFIGIILSLIIGKVILLKKITE